MPNVMLNGENATSGKPEQILSTSQAAHQRIASSVYGNYPATWSQKATYSGTSATLATSFSLTSFGIPFQNIILTKSAAAETATAVLAVTGLGKIMLHIQGLTAETIAVTASIDGTHTSNPLHLTQNAGSSTAASAIGNGTYFVVTE